MRSSTEAAPEALLMKAINFDGCVSALIGQSVRAPADILVVTHKRNATKVRARILCCSEFS
jgi:hypothetical protein